MTTLEIQQQIEQTSDPKERMKLMVMYLKRYMETYDKQPGYENYGDDTLINDVLYGLGVALDPDNHTFASGFDLWKKKLVEHIQKSL